MLTYFTKTVDAVRGWFFDKLGLDLPPKFVWFLMAASLFAIIFLVGSITS